MEINKDKVKRSAIASLFTGGALEYLSASVIKDFEYFKNYEFDKFWNLFNSNLASPIDTFSNVLSNDLFLQAQPFILGGMLFVGGKVLLNKNKEYEEAYEYGAYGTARWAKKEDVFNGEDFTSDIKKPGMILGKFKNQLIIQHDESHLNRNVLIVGGSGAGKTRAPVMSNILKNNTSSQVIIDPKGELYESTSEMKRKQGFDVRMVNFKNRNKSDRYNLFDYLRRDADAFKIANAIVSNASEGTKVKKDFWNMGQISVLQALILYVKYALPKEEQHMGSVYSLASTRMDIIGWLFNRFPRNHIVCRAYNTAIAKLGEKTGPDVFQTLMQTLNPWQYDDVCEFTQTNDFLFEDLGKKKMIIYVIIPVADNEFRPLISTFFTQMFSELYLLADQNFGVLPNPVWLGLDEFANIGKLPDFETRISTTRSLGIDVSIIIQDISQLESRYGKELAKEIISNCDTRMLLKANDIDTAKYFSRLAGKTTIRIKNNSNSQSSKSSSKSESSSYIQRDLITESEVTGLKKKEQLLFVAGYHPMRVEKSWFNKIKAFKGILGKKVSREDYELTKRDEYKCFIPPTVEEINAIIEQEQDKNKDAFMNDFFSALNGAAGEAAEKQGETTTVGDNVIDTETGEILELMNESEPTDEGFADLDNHIPPEPQNEEYNISLEKSEPPQSQEENTDESIEDLMKNFKF